MGFTVSFTKNYRNPALLRSVILLLTLIPALLLAQDDHPDYRKKYEGFSKVPDKEIRKDMASFAYAGIDESISKLALRSIDTIAFTNGVMKFSGNNTRVIIETGKFDPTKHKLQYYEEKFLMKIDGKGFHGDYGKVPVSTITAITVLNGADTIRIPATAFFDIYNSVYVYKDKNGVQKTRSGVYFSGDKRRIYIHLVNRDNMDKYEVTFIIQDKKYLRRVVDFNLP